LHVPKKKRGVRLVLRSRAAGATLFRWLYDEIRAAILDGRLPAGARLPSTRTLASEYGVARGTVVAAFDQLCAEGYLASGVGSGTFVRKLFREWRGAASAVGPGARGGPARTGPALARLSTRGRRLVAHPFPRLWSNVSVETFRLDRPALDAFPLKLWSRIAAGHLRRGDAARLLAGGDPLGFRPLRESIAGYLELDRGVKCTADQVVITTGTQQSLALIAQLVLDPGERVWMEDPGYAAATALLRALGAEVIGVPVDACGIDCEAGLRRARGARLAYVTPSCQFPLGCTLSLQRRLALLRWAQEESAWIFEDDYDSQLRFSGRPLAALRSLDNAGCVIYSNSFNKMLFTSLRLGFLVLPPRLIGAAAAARSIVERFPAVLEQVTLCDFISAGHMEQHMRRMRELYAARFDTLVRAARREFDGLLQLAPSHAGLQAVAWLAPDIDEDEACGRAAECGINSVALSKLTIDRPMPAALVLGVGSAHPRAIRRGMRGLNRVLQEMSTGRRSAGRARRPTDAANRQPGAVSGLPLLRAQRLT
jgi:GntR family transcriptional regulator / MocR family aminotransferase